MTHRPRLFSCKQRSGQFSQPGIPTLTLLEQPRDMSPTKTNQIKPRTINICPYQQKNKKAAKPHKPLNNDMFFARRQELIEPFADGFNSAHPPTKNTTRAGPKKWFSRKKSLLCPNSTKVPQHNVNVRSFFRRWRFTKQPQTFVRPNILLTAKNIRLTEKKFSANFCANSYALTGF